MCIRRAGIARSPWTHRLWLAACLPPLGISASALLAAAPWDLGPLVRNRFFWPAALTCILPLLVWAALRPARASRVMRGYFLGAIPVIAFILLEGLRGGLAYPHEAYADVPAPAAIARRPEGRVVWIIFDGMSEAMAFERRPAKLQLPNLDRLRKESFYATAAEAPADATLLSLPALILGAPVRDVVPADPRTLHLRVAADRAALSWGSLRNVFDDARKFGLNTALAGWYHPYGRVLGHSLTRCAWTAGWLPAGAEEPFTPQTFATLMRDRALLQISTLPLAGHIPLLNPVLFDRARKLGQFRWLGRQARAFACDPALGLVLIHAPVPHPPAIYDRRAGQFAASGSYLDNLALADRTLGEWRAAMERAGILDNTTLILSADHGWRVQLWRGKAAWTAEEEAASAGIDSLGVPFIVRLPHREPGMRFDRPFNTVITRRLIGAVLHGDVATAADLASCIERFQDNQISKAGL
jgi:hypothetical protein